MHQFRQLHRHVGSARRFRTRWCGGSVGTTKAGSILRVCMAGGLPPQAPARKVLALAGLGRLGQLWRAHDDDDEEVVLIYTAVLHTPAVQNLALIHQPLPGEGDAGLLRQARFQLVD